MTACFVEAEPDPRNPDESWYLPAAIPGSLQTITVTVTHQGRMYISADAGASKLWVGQVLARPDARLRIAGRVYPVRFVPVTDEAARDFIWLLEARKYEGLPADATASPPRAARDAVRFEVVSQPG